MVAHRQQHQRGIVQVVEITVAPVGVLVEVAEVVAVHHLVRLLVQAGPAFCKPSKTSLSKRPDTCVMVSSLLSAVVGAAKAAEKAVETANADGDGGANEAGFVTNLAQKIMPDLGRKLDYMFGLATGRQHNIDRSLAMKATLEKIGIIDTPETRAKLGEYFTKVMNDSRNIVEVNAPGFVQCESILVGTNGAVRVISSWEGNRLVTIILYEGK